MRDYEKFDMGRMEADIERTRTEIEEDLERIQYKLSLEHLKERAQRRMREVGCAISEKAQGVSSSVIRRAKTLGNSGRDLGHTIRRHPAASAAIAAGVGVVLGLLIPRTEREDGWMGESRNRVVHKAKVTARRAKERTRAAMHEAREQLVGRQQ
ncbi:MAG: hypothetical protein ACRD1R_06750 [Acidobacteriota bacterium]